MWTDGEGYRNDDCPRGYGDDDGDGPIYRHALHAVEHAFEEDEEGKFNGEDGGPEEGEEGVLMLHGIVEDCVHARRVD